MINKILSLALIFIIQPSFADNSCKPKSDTYYEKHIVGKMLEAQSFELFGKNYSAITIFKKNHTFIGKVVNSHDFKDAVKAVRGEWKIKNGKLYEMIKETYIPIRIVNSKSAKPIAIIADEIMCMNKNGFKAMNAKKAIYTNIKIS